MEEIKSVYSKPSTRIVAVSPRRIICGSQTEFGLSSLSTENLEEEEFAM